MKTLNEMMYYNREELNEMIDGSMDIEWIAFCICAMYRHYVNPILTDEILDAITDWAEYLVEG